MKLSEMIEQVGFNCFGTKRLSQDQWSYAAGVAIDEWQRLTDARLAKLEARPVKAVDGDWMLMKGETGSGET